MLSCRMNSKAKFTATIATLILVLAIAAKTINVPNADTASPLAMPEEYVNYTITRANGVLWAKIDGTYPLYYSGSDAALPMVYPTPPGTTNNSVRLNEVEVEWSNYTKVYPEALHLIGIGHSPRTSRVLDPTPDR